MTTELVEANERELAVTASAISQITAAEIDTQIATAKKYPRSIKRFVGEATQMVAMNEAIADACIYALPRDGKTIEGPSARFAEIIFSAWGNCRAGARVVADDGEFITAQGICHDLERNTAIAFEVRRRITDKRGRRYNADMIGVTGNAASSIALRNAILKVIPKAFWEPLYETARQTVRGDFQTLANRRAKALEKFQGYGIKPEQVYAVLGVAGSEDITLDHLVVLRGMLTAIKEGELTPEQAFASDKPDAPKLPQGASATANLKARLGVPSTESAPPSPHAATDLPPPPVAEPEAPAHQDDPGATAGADPHDDDLAERLRASIEMTKPTAEQTDWAVEFAAEERERNNAQNMQRRRK